jgi:hypothetical protein
MGSPPKAVKAGILTEQATIHYKNPEFSCQHPAGLPSKQRDRKLGEVHFITPQ